MDSLFLERVALSRAARARRGDERGVDADQRGARGVTGAGGEQKDLCVFADSPGAERLVEGDGHGRARDVSDPIDVDEELFLGKARELCESIEDAPVGLVRDD